MSRSLLSQVRGAVVGLCAALLVNVSSVSACNVSLSQGQTGYWWVGGFQTGSTVLYGDAASLNARNPSPVYTASSAWTALENHTTGCSGCIAQVGWFHTYYLGNPTIFTDFTNSSGVITPSVAYNQMPSGTIENFKVQYVDGPSGNPVSFGFQWNEGAASANAYFKPYGIPDLGEVQDFTSCSPIDCGSQAVGDSNDTINFTGAQYTLKSGAQYTANLNYSNPFARTPDQRMTSYSGSSFSTWDSRCTS